MIEVTSLEKNAHGIIFSKIQLTNQVYTLIQSGFYEKKVQVYLI